VLAQQLQNVSIRQRPVTYAFDKLAKFAPVRNRHACNGVMNIKLIAARLSNFPQTALQEQTAETSRKGAALFNNVWRELFAAMQQIALFGMRGKMSATYSAIYCAIRIRE
jgi:hypothetical protein